MEAAMGDDLGHFSLLEKIGEGGMGRVYKARDKNLDRLVAIKVLAEGRTSDASQRSRFIQEAKAASALNHPHIITIHEIDEQDGQIFIVMELLEGKPLSALIPANGMRIKEVLRVGSQVADALTAAHSVGIVHRDLKPANIMVDSQGRVKVLDFGLAKLIAAGTAPGPDEATRTLVQQAITEEGVILGSIPYLSPEQAEGKPIDARSDIFSFGAVLYEMITGKRAFSGGSRIATLAAIVERDPEPPSRVSDTCPPELDRLIARCLRKEVQRRSQTMADVRVALEELRDESQSGTLSRALPPAKRRGRGWQPLAAACLLAAAIIAGVSYFAANGKRAAPEFTRLSPDDGKSYRLPAISPDGGFVAYIADRSGSNQLWLQQVGGGAPIQLTHSEGEISFPAFFPDGKRIVYIENLPNEQHSKIAVISTLGGEPRVLTEGGLMLNWSPMLSPDGKSLAFYESRQDTPARLMTMPSAGGTPQEVRSWTKMRPPYYGRAAWTPDSSTLITLSSKKSQSSEELDWFAVPLDGSDARPMGLVDVLHATGQAMRTAPMVIAGNRALFSAGVEDPALWQIGIAPGPWHLQGAPRQLTNATQAYMAYSVDSTGTVAMEVTNLNFDLYLLPLTADTGRAAGPVVRLTHDRRDKQLNDQIGGDPAKAYFLMQTTDGKADYWRIFTIDLVSRKQESEFEDIPFSAKAARISPDGRLLAFSVKDDKSQSMRLMEAKVAGSRVLCQECGDPYLFSPDGRFILYAQSPPSKLSAGNKKSVRILEVSTGKNRLWLEDSADLIQLSTWFGTNSGWILVTARGAGSPAVNRGFLAPWQEQAVPRSEWIQMPLGNKNGGVARWRASRSGSFFYAFRGPQLIAVHFDTVKKAFGTPFEVIVPAGSEITPGPDDRVHGSAQGLVFSREESTNPVVWVMKLPPR
jgi:Tol biopolymer transport system component/tRNA A-37 threonylcarbamoyl transferase component Bud32